MRYTRIGLPTNKRKENCETIFVIRGEAWDTDAPLKFADRSGIEPTVDDLPGLYKDHDIGFRIARSQEEAI